MPIRIYKPIGLTPFELIQKFKTENNISDKVSFAGRLDPMAHGEMVLLKGLECKQQENFCGRNKIYEFEVLFGFKSDTSDILGLAYDFNSPDSISLDKFQGEVLQSYPIYSSKTIDKNGKKIPLWNLAKSNNISLEEIPKKIVNIYEINKLNENFYNNLDLREMIFSKLGKLSKQYRSKFRYDEIIENWNYKLKYEAIFKIEKYRATVSSGTYIRSLCERMGGLAYDIKRVCVL
jgi:tRNA pseudouridine(55) synthase